MPKFEKNCLYCGVLFGYNSHQKTGKYCSQVCCGADVFRQTMEKFKRGEINSPNTVKKCFAHEHNQICHECGNNGEYNGKPLVLQLDHIDGNSDNNLPENLRWMCPNCHSQTPTYGRKGRTLKETKREEYRRKHYKSSK